MRYRICDMCGQPLEENTLRYEARIQVYAAYDPLEISFADLKGDFREELRRVAEACRDMSEEELMRQVFTELHLDLCPRCQQVYIRNPLPQLPDSQ